MFTPSDIQNIARQHVSDAHIKDVERLCDIIEGTKNLDRRIRTHVLAAQIRIFAYICVNDDAKDIVSSLILNVSKNPHWEEMSEEERCKIIKRCIDTFEEDDILEDVFIMYI